MSARIRPCPPAPALRRLGPGPPPARSSSTSESSEQLPSIAPRWPHSESLGPECATTWPAVRRRVALHSSIAGVARCADGCLPSGGRARSESVSASCAMVGWALSIGLIDSPFSHWTHVTFKQLPPEFDGCPAVRGWGWARPPDSAEDLRPPKFDGCPAMRGPAAHGPHASELGFRSKLGVYEQSLF